VNSFNPDKEVRELIIHPAKNLEKIASFSNVGSRRVADYKYFMKNPLL